MSVILLCREKVVPPLVPKNRSDLFVPTVIQLFWRVWWGLSAPLKGPVCIDFEGVHSVLSTDVCGGIVEMPRVILYAECLILIEWKGSPAY